ncbi:MAG: hypothetical protein VKP62_02585 [Candidatus Sericytochromatia bacterium]|nr:hypothetical protein [Candidatus Sericytochromatia bacterium]
MVLPDSCLKGALALSIFLASLSGVSEVRAETVYKKDGTQVRGKIVKEDDSTLVVDTPEGKRKVLKKDIELLPPVSPEMAMMLGLLLSGGGHLYLGTNDKALMYLGLGAVVGGLTAASIRMIRPVTSTGPQLAVGALIGYSIPCLLGAFDAMGAARIRQDQPRFHIDY